MGEAKDLTLSIRDDQESNEANPNGHLISTILNQSPTSPKPKTLTWWIRIAVYSLSLLAGQSTATLLGRLYFEKGGESKWLATLVQLVGFPLLLPYYFNTFLIYTKNKNPTTTTTSTNSCPKQPSKLVIASIYIVLGLIIVADCYLYSVGLMYLPVSTYPLICASQLAFNALFSYFLNSQKFTPFIINSLALLTVSSVLLVFNSESEDTREKVSRAKYAIGFVCTVGGSAGNGLVFSSTQFLINKVLRREDFRVIIDVVVWESLVATIGAAVGLFVSGEWAGLGREMGSFGLGKASYAMVVSWTAVAWQFYCIGIVGLILEVSSLFSNVISAMGLPVVPVFAVFVFGEKMNGLKVVAMLLAIWGFVSYTYQNYLDTQGTEVESQNNKREAISSPQRERERSVVSMSVLFVLSL